MNAIRRKVPPSSSMSFGRSPPRRSLSSKAFSGTQGVVGCQHCEHIYAASFLTAGATVSAVRKSRRGVVSIKDPNKPEYPGGDLPLCMDLDRCAFAIPVIKDGDRLIGVRSDDKN